MIKYTILVTVISFVSIISVQLYISNNQRFNAVERLKLFQTINDTNANYSLTVYADLPVRGDVSQLIDWSDGYPGHSFIQLHKSNQNQQHAITFGFYPRIPFLGIIYLGDLQGQFRDDSRHDYDISYTTQLTSSQFTQLINIIRQKGNTPSYNVQRYNCTDFVVELMNASRASNPVIVHRELLGNSFILSTPGALYEALIRL